MKRSDYLSDKYAKLAGKLGHHARSYYKLAEIDKKYALIIPGQRLLDLGAHPGGWLKYVEKRTRGQVDIAALDSKPIQTADFSFKNFYFFQGDVLACELNKFKATLGTDFDGILSDLAPPTTGIRDKDAYLSYELVMCALSIGCATLVQDGFLLAKYYMGSELQEIQREFKLVFKQVSLHKPQATRAVSREIFILGRAKR